MPEIVLCKICGQRRARRSCPAVHGEICTICCGREREVSLSCPLSCEYLREGHRHEKSMPVENKDIPEPSVELNEDFLRKHEELLLFCVYTLSQAAMRTVGAVDTDVLAALDALIKTHHTSESGLIYETQADNTVAAAVQRSFSESLANYQKQRAERESLDVLRSSDIFKMLVFLRRFGQQNLNGRPRGRMFIDVLRHMTPETGIDEAVPSIIL